MTRESTSMTNRSARSLRSLCVSLLCLPLMWFAAAGVRAEDKFSGSNVDARTTLSFKVAPAALEKLVPPGWELSSLASGPAAGSNVQVTFADQLSSLSASGAPGTPVRYVLFYMAVKKAGADAPNLMIFTGLSPGGPGPYATNLKATDDVRRMVRYRGPEAMVEESWQLKADSGEAVSLDAQYLRGPLATEKSQARVYSQAKPEFSRIYRYEQTVDSLRENGVASDRLKKLAFKATGGKFASIFDGTEQLVAVSSIAWYTREIYLPAAP